MRDFPRIYRVVIALLCIHMMQLTAQAQSKIKIGISAPLTGDAATFGTDLRNVIQFANDELSNGRYQIIAEDDHCDGKGAVTVARKLVDIDGVSAAFFACDTAALVSAPMYKAKNILVLTPLVTSPRYSHLGSTFFRLAPNDSQNARILVSKIKQDRKLLGILSEGASEYCEDLGQEVERAANEVGLKFIHERFGPGTSDFKTLLLRLKTNKIDSLFINPTSEGPFLTILRQLDQLGISIPIYGSYTPGSATFQREAGRLAEGIVFTDFPTLPQLEKTSRALFEKFKQRFGPLNTWDFVFATGFESFRVMDQALRAGGNPSDFIRSKTFQGLLGEYRFDSHGDMIGVRNELRRISNGKAEILQQVID